MLENSRSLDSRRNHSRFEHGVYRWHGRERGVARAANKPQCHRDGLRQWVIESYALFLSALPPVGGSLGDHYGRRRVFVLGVTIFAVASAACGLAGNC